MENPGGYVNFGTGNANNGWGLMAYGHAYSATNFWIANGGTTAQDLKTAFLVGGTPRRQQLSLFVGVLTSAISLYYYARIVRAMYLEGATTSEKIPLPSTWPLLLALWATYGILRRDPVVIIGNTLTLLLVSSVVLVKAKAR